MAKKFRMKKVGEREKEHLIRRNKHDLEKLKKMKPSGIKLPEPPLSPMLTSLLSGVAEVFSGQKEEPTPKPKKTTRVYVKHKKNGDVVVKVKTRKE